MLNAISKDREILVIRANETVRQSWLNMLEPLSEHGYKSRGIDTRKQMFDTIDLNKIGLILANEDFTSQSGITELPKALKEKGHSEIPLILIVAPQTNERFYKSTFDDLYKDLEGFPNVRLIKEPFQREEAIKAATELLMGIDYKTRLMQSWADKKGLSVTFKGSIATITLKHPSPSTNDPEQQPDDVPKPQA